RYGLSAFSSSLDQIGPMTQNVEDAAILYDILAGFDKMDSTSSDLENLNVSKNLNSDRKLKIAVIDNYISQTSDDVRKACEDAVKALEEAGHEIIRKDMSNTEHHLSTYYVIAPAEASANLSRYDGVRYGNRAEAENLKELYFNTRTEGFGDEVKRRILLGTFVLSSGYYDAYYKKAQKVRHLIKDEFEEIFKEADLIFTPTAPTPAFEFGAKKDPLEMYMSDVFTISTNLAGLPGISVPVGKDGNGMPIGAQFIGKAYDEQTLFDGAMSLENILK
ncbi:MAG: aspartyl/glutamyl-tRNA amidotransferase subunit A, partial [Campylobacterales bacterium]|nr:aspartyl/glutamyl-tRNA amidotransferase subunit A [Campylobacterales bacterium]